MEKISLLTSSCCHSYFLPPPLSYFSLTSQTSGLHFPCMTAGWKIPAWLTDPAWPTCIVPCSPQTTYFPESPSELLLGSASKRARTILTCTKSSWQGQSSPAPLSTPESLSSAFLAPLQALACKPAPTPLLVRPYQLLHVALWLLGSLLENRMHFILQPCWTHFPTEFRKRTLSRSRNPDLGFPWLPHYCSL